jgi:hypothetical protein
MKKAFCLIFFLLLASDGWAEQNIYQDLDMNDNNINSVATPVAGGDAVNKDYHDSSIGSWGSTLTAPLTNKSGVNTTEGYVYRLDPDNNDSFDYGSEDEDAQVVVATNTVINSDAIGNIVIVGYEDVYVTTNTDRGDYLYFSATSGQAKPDKNDIRDGAFAQAIAARTGPGLVKAYVFPRERERKWAISDEPTWTSHIRVPLGYPTKYANNPIVSHRAGKWDSGIAWGPCVKKWDNEYRLYYTGGPGVDWETWSIGLYTSSDPITGYAIHSDSDNSALISAPSGYVAVGSFYCLVDFGRAMLLE